MLVPASFLMLRRAHSCSIQSTMRSVADTSNAVYLDTDDGGGGGGIVFGKTFSNFRIRRFILVCTP